MNPNQPGIPGFMPFPFIVPQQPVPTNQAPARVLAAMSFLQDLTLKTMVRAAVDNHGSLQEVPGQKLSKEEQDAQAAACQLLADYFRTSYDLDQWENKQVGDACENPAVPSDRRGLLVNCFACPANNPRDGCMFCKGTGAVLVFSPVKEQ